MGLTDGLAAFAGTPASTRSFNETVGEKVDRLVKRLVVPDSPAEWERQAQDVRGRMLELFSRGHPAGFLDGTPNVDWQETIDTGAGYSIQKLAYEGYPGLWVPALLYVPDGAADEGKTAAVLNTNGHHTGGKAMDYKQARCINLAKRGMLALNIEFIGMGQLTASIPHNRLACMDLFGVSGVGVFYSAVKRGLDVLLSLGATDPTRLAVTGLSGGGWQAAILSALDTRVTVSVPVAGHSPVWQRAYHMGDIGDLEQVPPDLCTVADYDTLTALIAPRPLLLMYNRYDDCCFQSDRTRGSVYETAEPVYELLGAGDRIEFRENLEPGTHNYDADNRSGLYTFLNTHFHMETLTEDLPWQDEILTETELSVRLPRENESLVSLGIAAARGTLAGRAAGPDDSGAPETTRRRLREALRLPEYTVSAARTIQRVARKGVFAERLLLEMAGTFSVPAVVVERDVAAERTRGGCNAAGGAGDTLVGVVLQDVGRDGRPQPEIPDSWAAAVWADVFGTGERAADSRYHMLLAGAGERSLGIQVAQIGRAHV
jgi:dienelactone hydrolase